MARYEEASRRVFEVFERFSPLVEPLSIDEAFVDVSGARTLFGDGRSIAEKIRSIIRAEIGLAASIGVASNKFLAKLASEKAKPDGLFVVPEGREAIVRFLGEQKIGALWGVGKVTGATLDRAGFRTVADIQNADPSCLTRLLGESLAAHLRALAFGEDSREVETTFEEKSCPAVHLSGGLPRPRRRARRAQDAGGRGGAPRACARPLCDRRAAQAALERFQDAHGQAPFEAAVCDDFSFREAALRLFDAEQMIHRAVMDSA
jgi:nucleotidyltransferase/DNA polymerase involved in DNA repair